MDIQNELALQQAERKRRKHVYTAIKKVILPPSKKKNEEKKEKKLESVVLFPLVERFSVSRMRDFYSSTYTFAHLASTF